MSQIHTRFAVPSDIEALVALETRAMHFPMGHHVREWFRDDYPSDYREHFVVAEDADEIVSVAALLSDPILYRGVPLRAAQWEAVVTDEAYRRRGLCRQLFKILEERSDADILFVQGLTWLYRRFGYHPALRSHGGWDSAGRSVRLDEVPVATLSVRPAVPDDAPFLRGLREASSKTLIVSCPLDDEQWRWTLHPDRTVAGPGETGLNRWREWRILHHEGQEVGAFAHDPWDLAMLTHLEISDGATTWREAGAAAIRATAEFSGAERVRVTLPTHHPLFAAYPRMFEQTFRGYGDWAARIPDPVGFLRKIAPALNANLTRSALAGWIGEISLSRITDGVTIRFESGRFAGAEPWQGARPDEARVRLTPGRFEALVLGYRSITATLAEDPDCNADEESEAVLAALFPPGDSFYR